MLSFVGTHLCFLLLCFFYFFFNFIKVPMSACFSSKYHLWVHFQNLKCPLCYAIFLKLSDIKMFHKGRPSDSHRQYEHLIGSQELRVDSYWLKTPHTQDSPQYKSAWYQKYYISCQRREESKQSYPVAKPINQDSNQYGKISKKHNRQHSAVELQLRPIQWKSNHAWY